MIFNKEFTRLLTLMFDCKGIDDSARIVVTNCKGYCKHLSLKAILADGALALPADLPRDTCYFGLAARNDKVLDGKTGTAKQLQLISAFAVDLDIAGPGHKGCNLPESCEEALRAVEHLPPPSAVVSTGGGRHLYWFLKTPLSLTTKIEVDYAKDKLSDFGASVLNRGQESGFDVDNIFQLARLLRVPGSRNIKKADDPKTVEILELNNQRYELNELIPSVKTTVVSKELRKNIVEPPPADNDSNIAQRWMVENSRDFTNPARECPVCGHRDCFGLVPEKETLYSCFSANHDSNGCSRGIQREGCFLMDSLELEAHERGMTRNEVLKADGYIDHVRKHIDVTGKSFGEVADAIGEGVVFNDKLYRHGDDLVRAPLDNEKVCYSPLSHLGFWAETSKSLRLTQINSKGEVRKYPDGSCEKACKVILENPRGYRFREIVHSSLYPILLRDGSVLTSSGYDEHSRYYLIRDYGDFDFPKHPGLTEAKEAFKKLGQLFHDFPFMTSDDKAALIGLSMTLAASHLLSYRPPFVTIAHTPGTGKTLCNETAFLIGAPGQTYSHIKSIGNKDEFRKEVLSLARGGNQVAFVDNAVGMVGSPHLSSIVTSRTIDGRILGVSKAGSFRNKLTFVINGNNVKLRDDLGRRAAIINLVTEHEHPEERVNFRIPNLNSHVQDNQLDYYRCVLIVLSAYINAGEPKHVLPPHGSFEDWDDLIRGAIYWVSGLDVLSGKKIIKEDLDSDRQYINTVLLSLHGRFGSKPFRARDIKNYDFLDTALYEALEELKGGSQMMNVGSILHSMKGRIVDGMRLIVAKRDPKRGNQWQIEEVKMKDESNAKKELTAAGISQLFERRPLERAVNDQVEQNVDERKKA